MEHVLIDVLGEKFIAFRRDTNAPVRFVPFERFMMMLSDVRSRIPLDENSSIFGEELSNTDVVGMAYDLLRDQAGKVDS